ncbi:hypothetical protein [Arthrobacter sp. SPG23]|uniref:hypothetical protein n=1 Tax=Arthrobacter sp. SPG23 TaxID=1610703 RepID=UPI001364B818|nr:hypothetical protein [Arthrobacter sp. SPG23]
MADSSTEGSANVAVIPVLEGQTCIGELLPDVKYMVGMSSPEGPLADPDGSADGQLTLF